MSNNTVLNLGTGGDLVSDDQITSLNGNAIATGEKVQRMKLSIGAAGTAVDINTANPLPIIDNDTTASGTITAVAQTVAIALNGDSGAAIQITGTWVGTLQFEGTLDGTTWVAINATAASTSLPQVTNTVNGLFRLTPSGLAQMRINATAWTSGTATISIRAGAGTGGTFINQVAPVKISDGTTLATIKAASTAAIATDPAIVVAISPNNTIPVSGTFFQTTQPVSLATNTPDVTDRAARLLGIVASITNALPTGANVIGKTSIDQTTDGTTNAVRLLPETTKVIGTVNVASAQTIATTNAGTFAVQAAATLAAETTKVIGTINVAASQTIAVTQTTAANLNATVTQQAITKNTQGATGVTTQDLKDAGRNAIHFYTIIPVLSTATDTLQSLTGTKSGVTVVATTTPAVVTTGKTFRVTRLSATYIATSVSGYGIVRLRFNTAGVVAITSPIAATLAIGASTPATANSTGSEEAILDEGWEFAAATGVGISVQGFAAVTATAVGYLMVSVTGYEY